MIYPGVARIFDQFGILKNILDTITPLQRQFLRWPDGSINVEESNVILLHEKFDIPAILFNRQRCVEHLYDGLPDQSKIRTSARVERIEHTAAGVKVYLPDGTYEEGDILVGADGVHSLVRQIMWDYASEKEPDAMPESDKKALFTQYKGIFGVSNRGDLPDMGPADVHVVLGEDTTKLVFTQNDHVYWAITYKDEYSAPPKQFKPDQKEQDTIAQKFKDLKIAETLTFGHLYENKTRSGVLNIEEGILEKWHVGRIVLVGDAAHKVRQYRNNSTLHKSINSKRKSKKKTFREKNVLQIPISPPLTDDGRPRTRRKHGH
jgi:2-polyprenyl-6-methoxyphenol hydroxylase-like FAD-dependent oxidoreductase